MSIVPKSELQATGADQSAALLSSLGVAIVLAGQPIAWFIRGDVGGGKNPIFPIVAIMLGLALVLLPLVGRKPRLYVPPIPLAGLILMWLLPVGATSLLDLTDLGVDGGYAIFLAIFAVAIACTPISSLRLLPHMMTLVGGVSSILPLANLFTGDALEKFVRLNLGGSDNQAIAGMIGGVTMIAAVQVVQTTRRPGMRVGLGCSAAFAAGAACVVLSNTRSIMAMLAVCLPLLIFVFLPRVRAVLHGLAQHGGRQRLVFWSLIATAIGAAPIAATALLGTEMLTSTTKIFAERLQGALGLFEAGGLRSIDLSSQIRVDILDYTWRRLDLVGHGVSDQVRSGYGYYPHLTYLQALYDLGVLGAIFYAFLALILPVSMIWQRLKTNCIDQATAFVSVYFVFGQGDQFSHSTPYSWLGLAPIVLVYVIVPRTLVFGGTLARPELSRRESLLSS